MKRLSRRLFSVLTLLAVLAGLLGGLTLSVFSARARTVTYNFSTATLAVVSWRGSGDQVPPRADSEQLGWPAPMFYTTAAEGAQPEPPEGKYPTGVWAPGDSVERRLNMKNVGTLAARLKAVDTVLSGDTALAHWFHVRISAPVDQVLYEGTLAELAAGPQLFRDAAGQETYRLLPTGGEEQVCFTVTLDPDVPNDLQGKTLKADFRLYAGQHRNR